MKKYIWSRKCAPGYHYAFAQLTWIIKCTFLGGFISIQTSICTKSTRRDKLFSVCWIFYQMVVFKKDLAENAIWTQTYPLPTLLNWYHIECNSYNQPEGSSILSSKLYIAYKFIFMWYLQTNYLKKSKYLHVCNVHLVYAIIYFMDWKMYSEKKLIAYENENTACLCICKSSHLWFS